MIPGGELRIGDWRVDPTAGLISRGDQVERLEARTLRLLLDLAGHAGETVSIDDLLDRVWAGVIVTPDSVYQAVATLRRLLGDDPQRPRYIATVPRLGYRLVAKVEPWADEDADAVAERSKPRMPLRFVLLILALASLAAVVAYCNGRAVSQRPAATSVGVLVFLDMTASMDNTVMVEDFTERLATRLGQDPHLRTPGFRAALALRGRRLRPAEAAKVLGVDYVVDGSVHSQGQGFRLTANLIRADNGFIVWSHGYDETAQGMLTAQDAVAGDLQKALAAQRLAK
ncbi:winged helix-turn-helix domain-containing protein [Phenylobacterium sp.]|jgi:DNA-binding winged helix-turn-helix (wHTH) protein|uniref:winged helix-turn-helix domain-containing protein n=1 Tax=Phenylobacterium sp. TaxID=1871053 RepID=UPI002F414928